MTYAISCYAFSVEYSWHSRLVVVSSRPYTKIAEADEFESLLAQGVAITTSVVRKNGARTGVIEVQFRQLTFMATTACAAGFPPRFTEAVSKDAPVIPDLSPAGSRSDTLERAFPDNLGLHTGFTTYEKRHHPLDAEQQNPVIRN